MKFPFVLQFSIDFISKRGILNLGFSRAVRAIVWTNLGLYAVNHWMCLVACVGGQLLSICLSQEY